MKNGNISLYLLLIILESHPFDLDTQHSDVQTTVILNIANSNDDTFKSMSFIF